VAPRGTSDAVEDYVKALYALESRRGGESVGTVELAQRLGVTPGSVSAMLRKLASLGLADLEPYRGVRLTDQGRELALEVVRHHRLLELYLASELDMPWDRVHEEAEVLEHVLSEDLEARIAAKLGHPTRDPHGDPIPTSDLRIIEPESHCLQELETGQRGRFVRVSDSDPAMLRYLSERGIAPGDDFEVVDKQPFGGPLLVRFGDDTHALGGGLAQAMRVELAP
jgi:DtxR family Mn-dependent transcriptional regulator